MSIVKKDENNNQILGYQPKLIKSSITFKGKNNRLFCEEGITLQNSRISFLGDNAIIYLSKPRKNYQLYVPIYSNSVLFFDEFVTTNGLLRMALSEEKNIFIGKSCLFSFGIWFRLADPHLIYDAINKRRINYSKSIYFGDHVWVGQDALILKGTNIGSGSIIGAKSVVSNKKIDSNTVWGGNPAKEINRDIFWDVRSVHRFNEEDTKKSSTFADNRWIYELDATTLNVNSIEKKLKNMDVDEKVEYLIKLRNNNNKNRFYMCYNNE